MNESIKQGKKKTIQISISILLLSLFTIYNDQTLYSRQIKPEIDTRKLIHQIIPFLLTAGLLYALYKGKKWAKTIFLIIFTIAIFGLLGFVSRMEGSLVAKTPYFVMLFIFSLAVYHFGFSESYKAFSNYQNGVENKPVENSEALMDKELFWKIIETSKSKSQGDYEKQQEELKKLLLQLTPDEIIEFDNRFQSLKGQIYDWDFWAAAYIIRGGCSDDCFSDFRGWLIGQGKEIFEKAIEDIETLSELDDTNDGDWEGLSYVPLEAYELKTGKPMPGGLSHDFELSGKRWEEDKRILELRYPKLMAKFGDKIW